MEEKVPQTMYTFEQMRIEGEKRREQKEEMEKEVENAKNH